jgi:hypothetical protein
MSFTRKPPLTVPMILEWIDAHTKRTGVWPNKFSGPVADGNLGDNCRRIDNALKLGLRGLLGGYSLAKLLVETRGVRVKYYAPDLTETQIREWADRHFATTGDWPTEQNGAVPGEKGEGCHNIDAALRQGLRGLPGGMAEDYYEGNLRHRRRHLGREARSPEQIRPAKADAQADTGLGEGPPRAPRGIGNRRVGADHRGTRGDLKGGRYGLAAEAPRSQGRVEPGATAGRKEA